MAMEFLLFGFTEFNLFLWYEWRVHWGLPNYTRSGIPVTIFFNEDKREDFVLHRLTLIAEAHLC